jgi:putative transposase
VARALRLDSPGDTWHLFSRGNNHQDIFLCDADRLRFLALLADAVARYKWIVHEYELMTNHYHLVLDTPEPTLSRGMQWLNGKYAQWFNRTHDRDGHLFQGRFHGVLVEKEAELLNVCRYVALNAVDAGIVARPEEYRW